MIYECIKTFCVESVDDNGFCIENKGERIQKGSVWKPDESKTTLTGAELRMNDITGLRWIEISNERLDSHFKQLD